MNVPTAPQTAYLDQHHDPHYEALLDFLRIPSVSTDPARATDTANAADWVAAKLRAAGVPEVELLPTPGHPVVFGRWHDAVGAPTLLVYGHYDVQPPDPLDLWETPPFEPTERDGLLYARGSADMKANLLTLVQAVEAFARTTGKPPINLTFLFEGEEEIGSPNLPAVIRANRDRLACDVALSADGGMFAADTPSLTVALKGIVGCQLDLRTGSTDLHSGSYGAAVPNAVQQLVRLAATFHDATDRVAVAGFYDDVRPLTDGDRAELAAVPFDEADYRAEAGVDTLWGESGYTPLERRWTRPTLDLNGIWGGFQGDGTKTVTPCEAHLKITCRLVPDQDPEQILKLLERHVAQHTPPGITTTLRGMTGSSFPYALDRTTPALATARAVLRELYGKDPLIVRSGGTVPITEVFKRDLGVDTVTIGFGLPGSRAHAPNEWFRLANFDLARRTYTAFFAAMANAGS
jgi:acetylornithine deacetylase/succinyl-diaminopimelate desuccinylase-like protein